MGGHAAVVTHDEQRHLIRNQQHVTEGLISAVMQALAGCRAGCYFGLTHPFCNNLIFWCWTVGRLVPRLWTLDVSSCQMFVPLVHGELIRNDVIYYEEYVIIEFNECCSLVCRSRLSQRDPRTRILCAHQ